MKTVFLLPFFLCICSLQAYNVRFDEHFSADMAVAEQAFFDRDTVYANLVITVDGSPATTEVVGEIDGYFSISDGPLTVQRYTEGMLCLQQQGRYLNVEVSVAERSLHFDFTRAWILDRVYIKGVWFGRGQLMQQYSIRPGEPFTEQLHQVGISHLEQNLHSQGYCDAIVRGDCVYHQKSKTVRIYLRVDHGKRFTFRQLAMNIAKSCVDTVRTAELQRSIFQKVLRLYKGDYYTDENYEKIEQQITEVLLKKGFYEHAVQCKKTTDTVHHAVDVEVCVALEDLKKVDFMGNSFFSSDELYKKLVPFPQMLGAVLAYAGQKELEELYKSYGFYDISVTVQDDHHQLLFILNEGKRYTFAPSQVIGSVGDTECTFVHVYEQKPFDHALVLQAKQLLVESYQKLGYWDCIVTEQVTADQAAKTVMVTYTIETGQQRFIGSFTYAEQLKGAQEYIAKLYPKLTLGKPFEVALLTQLQQHLRTLALNNGVFRPHVTPQFTERPDGIVDVRWECTGLVSGEQTTKTILRGYSKIAQSRIRGHLGPVSELGGRDRLLKLGVFDRVEVRPLLDTPLSARVVTVHDAPSLHYGLRGGLYCTSGSLSWKNITFKVGGDCVWKNVTHQADSFFLTADVTRYKRDVQGRYVFPFISHIPTQGSIKGYSVRYDQPLYNGSADTLYKDSYEGFSLQIDRDWGFIHPTASLGFEYRGVMNLRADRAEKICFSPRLVDVRVWSGLAEGGLVINTTDNVFDPHRGLSLALVGTARLPFTSLYEAFCRIVAEGCFYVPLGWAVLATRIRMGHVFNRLFCFLSPSDRFYLGGAYSIRGYDIDLVPPFVHMRDEAGCEQLVPVGGRSMGALNIEFRFPLIFNVQSSVFMDSGILLQDDSACAIAYNNPLVCSLGTGIYYLTPLGPLRLDVGYKLKRYDALEPRMVWHFSFGYSF